MALEVMSGKGESIMHKENVVLKFHLGVTIDKLEDIALLFGGVYEKDKFPAAVIRLYETKTVISIFTTGACVEVGCQTEDHGIESAFIFVRSLANRTNRFVYQVTNLSVCNLVYHLRAGYRINLFLFWQDLGGNTSTKTAVQGKKQVVQGPCYQFDARKFPGLEWKTEVEGNLITIMLFATGNGVVTGMKTDDQMPAINAMLYEKLQRYREGSEYRAIKKSEKRAYSAYLKTCSSNTETQERDGIEQHIVLSQIKDSP